MTVVYIIVGLAIGALVGNWGHTMMGAVIGALLGFLIGQMEQLRSRVHRLEGLAQRVAAASKNKKKSASVSNTRTPASQPEPAKKPVTAAPFAALADTTAQSVTPSSASATQAKKVHRPSSRAAGSGSGSGSGGSGPSTDLDPYSWLMKLLFGGNTVVRVGIIVLFVGVAFLLKYAAEHTNLPAEFRLIGVFVAAVIMLVLGWRLRENRSGYSLALQGGAVAMFYLTVFAAMRLYSLIPPGPAFVLLVGIAIFSAMIAIAQNSLSLAVFGITGGFLAPILASTGQGNHVMLFSYYALLNAGIVGIAWYKAWRLLNVLGFLFTFGIATAWGAMRYTPEHFNTTEPFLILFSLMYVGVAVLFAIRQKPDLRGYVDGTLVFGTPIVAFALQYKLVQPYQFGLAWSALATGFFYLTLGSMLLRFGRQAMRAMTESYLAIGVVFASLAVPLAVDGQWTSAIWALEGSGLIWIGIRQGRLLPRLFGFLLHAGAAVGFIGTFRVVSELTPVLNSFYIGCFILSVSALLNANLVHRSRAVLREWESGFIVFYLFAGISWWFFGGFQEIHRHIDHIYEYQIDLVFSALSCLVAYFLAHRLRWSALYWMPSVLLPVAMVIAAAQFSKFAHPFHDGGYLAWPLLFTVFYGLMRKFEHVETTYQYKTQMLRLYHIAGLWLLSLLLIWQTHWWAMTYISGARIWSQIAWVLVPGLYLLITVIKIIRKRWPLSQWSDVYIHTGAYPMVALLWLWSVAINFTSNGNPYPLTYVPILNPLDVSVMFSLLVIMRWALYAITTRPEIVHKGNRALLISMMGGALFLWLNAVLMRTLHFWADLDLKLYVIQHSVMAQAALSVFWGVLALIIMVFASRREFRTLWLVGAFLLAATVIKLFLVDLKNSSNLESIFSFIGVGVLAMIIGYLSPIPPKHSRQGGVS